MSKRLSKSEHIRQAMLDRESLFQRFGYDSTASLQFILTHMLPLPGHILEIGTGRGRFLAALAPHAQRITTLDLDPEQQRTAKCFVGRDHSRGKIRYVAHDAKHLPWPDASFDSVVSVNTFHHLPRPEVVLEEMLRVLKPGGKLAVGDFSPRGFQIFDRIHGTEGKTHPRLENGLADCAALLRKHGCRVKRVTGRNQEVLVATAPLDPRNNHDGKPQTATPGRNRKGQTS